MAVAVPTVPYRGIQPFRYADHLIFFARETETENLLRLVQVYRGVMLYGDSGSGKSSLINAGLLPEAGLRGFQPERIRVQPRAEEELVVERIAINDARDAFLPSLFATEDDLAPFSARTFEERLRLGADSARPLLVFDQFEELVTLFTEPGQCDPQQRIVDLVVSLLRDHRLPVKLLFAFREDYLASVKHLLAEVPELVDQTLRVSPPAAEELTTIIRGPFEKYPDHFERELTPGLAARLGEKLADRFGSGEVSLSEVQTVCLRLWQSENPDTLLDERDVQGILEDYLGEEVDAFPPDLRYPAVALLGQMVTAAGTRNVLPAETLIEKVRDEEDIPPQQLERALDRLYSESKLVRRERRHELYLYELTSEFLLPWISRRRDELVRLQDRRRERKRLLVVGSAMSLVAAVLVVTLLAAWALVERSQAKSAERSATALALGVASNEQRDNHLDVSLLLGLEAVRAKSHADARARGSAISALVAARRSGANVILHGHTGSVSEVAFSPDGKTVASAGDDETVRLWDVIGQEPVAEPLRGHKGPVRTVAFSPDGETLASAGDDGTLRLWDPASQSQLGVPLRGHREFIHDVAFSPDGTTLASAGSDGTLRLWDVAKRKPLGELLLGHDGAISGVAFSPDGTTLASAGADRTVRLWTIATRRPLGEPLRHESGVLGVAFSPDGKILASAGEDGPPRLWDLATRQPRGKPLQARVSFVSSVAFSPDAATLAAASDDGMLLLWDVSTQKRLGQPRRAHESTVTSVAFSPDGATLASTSEDRTVRLWKVSKDEPLGLPLRAGEGGVLGTAFGSRGATLASVSSDGILRLWDVATHEQLDETRLIAGGSYVSSVAFSPDGGTIAAVVDGGALRLWDTATGRPRGKPPPDDERSVLSVALSPDGATLVAGGDDGTVVLWDMGTGEPRDEPARGHDGTVLSVAFSPGGDVFASAGSDGSVLLWDAERLAPLGMELRGDGVTVSNVAFSPDGETLASADDDGTIRLWDVDTHEQVGQPMRGYEGSVPGLAFSPDGSTLATAGYDGAVRLWDVATRKPLGEPPLPLRHRGAATSVAFSPDGTTLASSGEDVTVQLWEGILWRSTDHLKTMVCGLVGGGLTVEEWQELVPEIRYRSSCS